VDRCHFPRIYFHYTPLHAEKSQGHVLLDHVMNSLWGETVFSLVLKQNKEHEG